MSNFACFFMRDGDPCRNSLTLNFERGTVYREDQPRQRLVVSLGCLKIPKKHRRVVGTAVEERLYGINQPLLLPPDRPREVREWIDYIVSRIEREGKWRPIRNKLPGSAGRASGALEKKVGETLDGVLIDELSHTHSTTLGPLLLGLHAWKVLKMPELLQYDLTNTHFEGVCASNPKAKRGRNKQKRHDCPQVVIGKASRRRNRDCQRALHFLSQPGAKRKREGHPQHG